MTLLQVLEQVGHLYMLPTTADQRLSYSITRDT